MKMSRNYSVLSRLLLLVSFFLCIGLSSSALAEVEALGNVSPTDPTTWDDTTVAYIGQDWWRFGAMRINNGSEVTSFIGFIGSNSMGLVAVDGAGSLWTSDGIDIGRSGGRGTLNITNGGKVVSGGITLGEEYGVGVINVDGIGSILESSVDIGFDGGCGVVNITNGATFSGGFFIESWWGTAEGIVTVDGPGSKWIGNFDIYGEGRGILNILNGAQAYSRYTRIGDDEFQTVASVSGPGSLWYIYDDLDIGVRDGQGTLNIKNDALVEVMGTTRAGDHSGGVGEIHFNGGTLTTETLLAGSSQLMGVGTINTHGLIVDSDAVLENLSTFSQINYHDPWGSNITVNLKADGRGQYLGAGHSGSGTLSIRNGVWAISQLGAVGYNAGSSGVVNVDGFGSTWQVNGHLDSWDNEYNWDGVLFSVGYYGDGVLNITHGGEVNCGYFLQANSYIGYRAGSTGRVTVDGAGSRWTSEGRIIVGSQGQGVLEITHGGLVRADSLSIDLNGDGDSYIAMATGGMLAIRGHGDDSLAAFLGLIGGTDDIRYWDDSISDWASLLEATYGVDYTLKYVTMGYSFGYTILTVGTDMDTIPEPAVLSLLALGSIVILYRKRSK
jgi:T5SS/PEP-CTERM-associated repeat protein